MTDKIYCGNGRIITTKFGEVPKISFSKDDINKMVQYMKDNKLDWINVEMKEKKNKEEKKPTHYIQVDTWKPDKSNTQPSNSEETDDLPF